MTAEVLDQRAPPPLLTRPLQDAAIERICGDTRSTNHISSTSYTYTFPSMSKDEIKKVALEHGGYATPSLNDQLYLHYKGYQSIENLEEYTNLKALWLDSNGLQTIGGRGGDGPNNTNSPLRHLTSLRCLFLQRNLLSNIGTGLHGLTSLVQLDISENRLTHIDGLESLVNLSNLNVSKNSLMTSKSIEHLSTCQKLSSVDLSHNELDGEDIIHMLSQIPTLLSLNMVGNPIASNVANFRKRMIVSNKSLRYLDRPIFDMERASAETWSIGGREAELKVKKEMQEKKRKEERASMEQFRAWQAEVRAEAQMERDRLAAGGAPTPAQIATEEERQRRKAEREANAAMEAARERDIYRIEMPLEIEGAGGTEDDDTSVTSDDSGSTCPVKITILEDPSSPSPPSPPPPSPDVTPPPLFPRDESVMFKEEMQMIENKQTPSFTQEMDHALCKYVQEFEANFDEVSAKMSKDFLFETTSSQFAFTPDLCRVRWCLLDSAFTKFDHTGAAKKPIEKAGDGSVQHVENTNDTTRPLRFFLSPDQGRERVTLQELCSMESAVMQKPVTFPSIDDEAHEGVDDNE